MAVVAALLLAVVLSTALGGVAMIAAVERRTAAAHATAMQLRFTARSAVAMAAGELAGIGFDAALQGAAWSAWRVPLAPPIDLGGLSAAVQREAMMQSAHGADTPVWRVFAHAPWPAVSGLSGPGQAVVWVADDWAESDGDPLRDRNGLILVRTVAVDGRAAAWAEALCGRDAGGRVEVRHVRSW